ncbi:MAG TPA: hypothetical protein VMT62_00380 [Syntrophorhabdaceae bacterium]|nr:hypothetical protein [Syntrophorhabdaceae bacterium]
MSITYNEPMRKITISLLTAVFISSCSYMPFIKKKDESSAKTDQKKAVNIEEAKAPTPGDIKMIDGVEYIYARNRRYHVDEQEPEYIWVRKDQFSPGLLESVVGRATASTKKERDIMEQRIAKLEEELKAKSTPQAQAYPGNASAIPGGIGFLTGTSPIAFDYPSPRMKRRVIVLPIEDQTDYKSEYLGDLATKRLISRLEGTGTIICVDPETTGITGSLTDPANMKILNEVFGIQAVLKSSLADVYTTTSRIENSNAKEASFALAKLNVAIYNTDTGLLLKQLSGRNPVSFSKEQGDLSAEKAKNKSIDLAIEVIADDILKAILYIDWHTRIVSIDEGKIYINAGRLSGLEKGRILEVYAPGEKAIDPKTKAPLGTTKGIFKGEIEVVELFGVDASWTTPKRGNGFAPTDLVCVRQ